MESKKEVWKPIKGYEGKYEVSSLGNVKSLYKKMENRRSYKERMLKYLMTKDGYCRVRLYNDGDWRMFSIHRLVAKAFIPNLLNLSQVNHKDEVKTNNCIDNLEWCTNQYNTSYNNLRERAAKSQFKRVVGINIINGYMIVADSIKDCVEHGFNRSCIGGCSHKKDKRKTHKGYTWSFLEEDLI